MVRMTPEGLRCESEEEDRFLIAISEIKLGDDLPKALAAAGADVTTFFEGICLSEHLDIRHWSLDGVSFKDAVLPKVVMTSQQRDQIASTSPEQLTPLILDPRDRHEDDFEEARLRIREAAYTQSDALDLSDLRIATLPEELAGLTELQKLWLSGTRVSNITPLAGLTALQELHVDYTQVSDIAPLAGLTTLRTLGLDNTRVSDLSPLSELTALRVLSLHVTRVSDIAPLAGLTALKSLGISGTQVTDISPLDHLKRSLTILVSD